jgi:hypothetical protein
MDENIQSDFSITDDDNNILSVSTEEQQHCSIPPPPESTFQTYKELEAFVKQWTQEHGYDVVITNTTTSKRNGKITKYLRCGRGGRTQNNRRIFSRVRNTSSVKSGCRMQLLYVYNEEQWYIRHEPNDRSTVHNHKPIQQQGHASTNHRRFERTEEMKKLLCDQAQAGISVKQSLSSLRTNNPSSLQTSKDIRNIRDQARQKALSTHSVVMATTALLEEYNFFFQFVRNEEGQLHSLFAAHPESIKLLRRFHDIFLFDCTYKTNKYGMPVLNICGVTGSNKTTAIAICLLAKETEEDFVWALRQLAKLLRQERISYPRLVVTDRDRALLHAIRRVFPNTHQRLCEWHMKKDIQAYTRSTFKQVLNLRTQRFVDNEQATEFLSLFTKALTSSTQNEFEEACTSLQTNWLQGWNYLEREWFKDYTDLCAHFVINEKMHFGIQSTSRVEGFHSAMKKWLRNSRSDVFTLIQRLIPWWEAMSFEVNQHVLEEEQQGLLSYDSYFYARLQRRIWRHTFKLLAQQVQLANQEVEEIARYKRIGKQAELSTCSGRFYRSYGVPCRHTIRDIKLQDGQLQLKDFDQHWHIFVENEYQEPPDEIREPVQRIRASQSRRKARQTGTGQFGNRRDPLRSERVDQNHPATPLPNTSSQTNYQHQQAPFSSQTNHQHQQAPFSSQTNYQHQQALFSSQTNHQHQQAPFSSQTNYQHQEGAYSFQTNYQYQGPLQTNTHFHMYPQPQPLPSVSSFQTNEEFLRRLLIPARASRRAAFTSFGAPSMPNYYY